MTAPSQTGVYDADRVFHPDYDDFSETAFCCGGLYLARRSLWNLVRQDEALFHCEWEDISFGLECQRRGLPHRVNPFVVAESTAPHPMLLTRLHTIGASSAERGRLHVSPEQEAAARSGSTAFKPVIARNREHYYESIRQRFNAIAGLAPDERLPVDFAAGCSGLADVWAAVERHVNGLRLTTRDEIAQIAFFLSDTVYKWPAPQILSWIKRHEESLGQGAPLRRFSTIVGWGTGSAFQANHRLIGRDLAFVIDSEPLKWGHAVDGITIRPLSALTTLDGERTAVVVFSCFHDEIAARIKAERPDVVVLPYTAVVANRRFQPLVDLVHVLHGSRTLLPAALRRDPNGTRRMSVDVTRYLEMERAFYADLVARSNFETEAFTRTDDNELVVGSYVHHEGVDYERWLLSGVSIRPGALALDTGAVQAACCCVWRRGLRESTASIFRRRCSTWPGVGARR